MESKISETALQPSCSKKYRNSLVQSSIPSTFQDRGKINTEVRRCLKHVLPDYRIQFATPVTF